jgi:hypothetical protein
VSNLCIACRSCNQTKGNRTAAEFGHPEVHARAKAPLKDAAAVNVTRWALFRRLGGLGLPLEVGTGGRTTFNRTQQGLPKTHWLDAACVGASTPLLHVGRISPLLITARGHGNRQTVVPTAMASPCATCRGAGAIWGSAPGTWCGLWSPRASTLACTWDASPSARGRVSASTATTCIPATSCGYRRQTAMLTHDSAPASSADAPFPSGL